MHVRMKQFWDSRSANYDAQFDRAPIRRHIMEEIARRVPQPAAVRRVMDLGAGTGRLTEFLSARLPDARFSLIDFSPKMLAFARTRLAESRVCEFHETDFAHLPAADGTVDLVVSACALHHVDDPGKFAAAAEIARVLRPGGLAVIVDEVICDPALIGNSAALDRRMREVFYPHEDPGVLDETFADIEEWPAELSRLTSFFESAGLPAQATPLNEIIAILTATRPDT